MRKIGPVAAILILIILALVAAGCTLGGSGTSTGNNVTGTGTRVPTIPATASGMEPTISLTPDKGKGGSSITVTGQHFPEWSRVEIHLGGLDTEATRQAYAATTANGEGDIDVDFALPDHWPNGDPIVQPQVVVVAATPDFVSKASAILVNESSPTP